LLPRSVNIRGADDRSRESVPDFLQSLLIEFLLVVLLCLCVIYHGHRRQKELQQKSFEKRVTLQLIRFDNFKVRDARRNATDKPNWKGTILSGGRRLEVGITDPDYFEMLNRGHRPSQSCFLTMSLGMPYKPSDWEEDEEPACWKLIAGVIELQKKK